MESFSIQQSLTFGWNEFNKRPWFFIGIMLFFFAISGVASYLSEQSTFFSVVNIIVTVFTCWLYIGLLHIMFDIVDGREVAFNRLFSATGASLLHYIVVMILSGLAVFAGLILLVVPGIIVGIMLAFSVYVLVDKNRGPIESMKASSALTKGHRTNLFWFFIVMALINMLGAIVFVVGLLVSVPVTLLAMVYVYRLLDSNTVPSDTSSKEVQLENIAQDA